MPSGPERGPRARLKQLPRVDDLLALPGVTDLPRWAALAAARQAVEARRQQLLSGLDAEVAVTAGEMLRRARAFMRPSLRRVLNATGVVLHTNLGRARLGPRALEQVLEAAGHYSNLEYDLAAGERGSRHDHVRDLVCELTGAEDACVVNNNAAAVWLGLSALARGREAVVSRGEQVEIGGSFRIPDVMRASGARMVEVGTTNRTRIADYEAATGEDTALYLKVHRSNFDVVGFTEEASLAELVATGARRGVRVMVDLGSGTLVHLAAASGGVLSHEPTVSDVVKTGVDLVTFSGDKLLGGPQAGILAGTRSAVDAARRDPVMRALRPDKLTLAALEATLSAYRGGLDQARREVPTLGMLLADGAELRARAVRLREAIAAQAPALGPELVSVHSLVGGGAFPRAKLPSWAVRLVHDELAASDVHARLRGGEVPVVARIEDEAVLLDVRTLADDEVEVLARVAVQQFPAC